MVWHFPKDWVNPHEQLQETEEQVESQETDISTDVSDPSTEEPENTEVESIEEPVNEDLENTDGSTEVVEETVQPEVTTDVPVEEPSSTQEPPVKDEHSPIVVLKVYGQEIPIYKMDELVTLAQQGVDYNSKMYALKNWKSSIKAIEGNNLLRELVDKAVKGEDINVYLHKAFSTDTNKETEVQESYDLSEITEQPDEFKSYLKEEVNKVVSPYKSEIDSVRRELFFTKLRSADPDYFDKVYKVMMQVYSTPGALPDGLKKDINEKVETFLQFYQTTRQALIAKEPPESTEPAEVQSTAPEPEKPTEQPEVPVTTEKPVAETTEVLKRRIVKKPPVTESARNAEAIRQRTLEEADSYWDLPDDKFKELVEKNRRRYTQT